MGIISLFEHLIRRPDPICNLLRGAAPFFPNYIAADRAHAARTIYLIGAVVAMGKSYSAEAEGVLQRELDILRAHLDTKSDAYRLAQWVLDLDDVTSSDAINQLVSPREAQIRMTRLQEAVTQV